MKRINEMIVLPMQFGQDMIKALTERLRELARAVNSALVGKVVVDGTLQVGGAVNYAQFESDGTLTFNGAGTVWQDIDFPIIARTAVANNPTPATLKGNITAPQWAVNDWIVCEGQEMIHAWREGTEVQWHIHVITGGTDTADRYFRFEIEWTWANFNGVLANITTTTSADLKIPANTADRTHIIYEISKVTFAGTIGTQVYARLKRVAAVGTAPTANVFCPMLQLHVECDTVGSRAISSK
jgi:hypothetical protein